MSIFGRAGALALLFSSFFLPLPAQEKGVRLGTDTEAPPQRLALLIGNTKYRDHPSLKNPKNDADQLAAELKLLGFQTLCKYDLSHDDFVYALDQFKTKIAPGDIALFYYSGHGVQLEGVNYLVPINMPSTLTPIIVQGSGISLPLVRSALYNSKISFIMLDACRTILNLSAKGVVQGLAPFFSRGQLVAYAADEGQAASDNPTERLSLFTKTLINELDKPDENLCQLFGAVRQRVDEASGHVQYPFVYDGVIGDFVFNPTKTRESDKLETLSSSFGPAKVWDAIQTSNDPNDFAAFLNPTFSDESHVKTAEDRLSVLMSSTVKAVGIAPLDAQSAAPEAVATANQGERLFNEEAFNEALKSYEKLLVLRPMDASMLYDYGTCLLHLRRYDEAIQSYSKAIELNREIPWSYFNRGVAYHLTGDLDKAIKDYNVALEMRPSYALGYNNLALAERDKGNFQDADSNVQKTIRLDPSYAPAFYNRARILSRLGDSILALQAEKLGKSLTIPELHYVKAMIKDFP